MNRDDILTLFRISDLMDLPVAVMKVLEGGIAHRNAIYQALIDMNGRDMERDWFQGLYEEELSQRKKNKQDFTPPEVCLIVSRLSGQRGTLHEPTAGTGGLIIADWWERCRKHLPWEHRPSEHMVTCWELSDRAIPLLLLNLSIRGIMGYVYHGDVLEKTVKQKYILLNRTDDTLAFSDVVRVGTNGRITKEYII